ANLQIISIGGLLFVGVVLVALFVLGFIILELMRDLRSFFDYFALRHRVIQRVRQADPVVYVPEGKDAVQRILAHLASSIPDVRGPGAPARAHVRVCPRARGGTGRRNVGLHPARLEARDRPGRPADARLTIQWKRTTAVFGPNLTACTGLISSLRISTPRAK